MIIFQYLFIVQHYLLIYCQVLLLTDRADLDPHLLTLGRDPPNPETGQGRRDDNRSPLCQSSRFLHTLILDRRATRRMLRMEY